MVANLNIFCFRRAGDKNWRRGKCFACGGLNHWKKLFILWKIFHLRRRAILFFFFSFFKKKLNFQFFCLSDRFFSLLRQLVLATVFSPNFVSPAAGWLNLRKLVTATVFLPKIFSPAVGWLIYELHLGILFFTQKTVSKTLLSNVFQTAFWMKKNSQM